ncbi:hypothetical protein LCGC14_1152090 [marine sediment metagenome]|uniref:Uncharacterized protein n=1 Tax=marine sediment metagenome TaxID=412755 RepID=A0A0F9M024_9ZZZZ|nr:hypothetical protein [archaeon]
MEDFSQEIPVLGEPLFVDGKYLYRELLYKYKKFKHLRYYQPDKELVEWLNMIDEFHECRLTRKVFS